MQVSVFFFFAFVSSVCEEKSRSETQCTCTVSTVLFKKCSWVVRMNKNTILLWQAEDGHLDMMDGLIVELLKDKWKTFVGHRCVKLRAQFLTFFNQILIVTANCLQISLDFPNV